MTSEVPSQPPSIQGGGGRGSDGGKKEAVRFATLIRKAQKQWSYRGIIEIDEGHRLQKISRCMQRGIAECTHHQTRHDMRESELTEQDYQDVVVKTLYDPGIKQHFEFHCYAPKVFASLRALIGVTEEEYVESLAPTASPVPCVEFITSSKSGMTFILSHNKAFIIKTEKHQDITFLRHQFLRCLFRHFDSYPHSLLAKIVGCYYIKMAGSKGVYFTVMQSVFYPDERITERYDLKGCSASRYVQPLEDGNKEIIVLKDNNFEGKTINIGAQASWFRHQVDVDSKFLEDLGIMDYSLLVGIQKLHTDEKKTTDKLADVVTRTVRSIKALPELNRMCHNCGGRLPTWNRRSTVRTRHPTGQSSSTSHPGADADGGSRGYAADSIKQHQGADEDLKSDMIHDGGIKAADETEQNNPIPGMVVASGEDWNQPKMVTSVPDPPVRTHQSTEPAGSFQTSHHGGNQLICDSQGTVPGTDEPNLISKSETTDGTKASGPPVQKPDTTFCTCSKEFQIDECNQRNQRLLPDTENPLHIIDGDQRRYFIGIIDLLTQYSLLKKMEHLYKCLRYPTETFSTVNPEHYARRFRANCYAICDPKMTSENGA